MVILLCTAVHRIIHDYQQNATVSEVVGNLWHEWQVFTVREAQNCYCISSGTSSVRHILKCMVTYNFLFILIWV